MTYRQKGDKKGGEVVEESMTGVIKNRQRWKDVQRRKEGNDCRRRDMERSCKEQYRLEDMRGEDRRKWREKRGEEVGKSKGEDDV